MNMRTILLSLLLLATVSVHASFETEPAAPTNTSHVVLQIRHLWRDGCVPTDPRVTRTGRRVEVRWEIPREVGCPAVIVPWHTDVPLGVFPAGQYELVLIVDDYDGLRTIATRSLVVREAQPAFRVEPDTVSTAVATEARIVGLCYGAEGAVVTMNGETVPSRRGGDDCELIVTLPPHAAGAVDLRVQHAHFDGSVVAAVRYVDPAAVPDSSVYERVLVPVLYEGGGAYGSEWATEVDMINASRSPAHFVPEAARPLTSLGPRSRVSLDGFGNRPSGLVLFVPRGFDIRFGSVIRDRSRDESQWGTELPVVRERDTRTALTLANVPFDPRYRVQLRIYEIDGGPVDVQVTASRGTESATKGYAVRAVCAEPPCSGNRPSYRSVDLTAELSSLMGKGRFDVTVANMRGWMSPRMWAFITVTNNETQHVTVISPQ
ncbi:MAG TPA: hypothetical protein VF432_32115 [Thermoanaerobaculia bacterium]